MTIDRTARRRFGCRVVLVIPGLVLAALAGLLASAGSAAAHPLDVYLQSTYLTLAPSTITVEIDLSPGVLIAPRVLPLIDTDHDEQVSDTEAHTYLDQVVADAELRADGTPLALRVTKVDVPPYLTIQAGYGTLRVFAAATGAPSAIGDHRIDFRNGFADAKATYQVNTFVAEHAPLTLGTQDRSASQQQATVSYWITADTAAAAATNSDRANPAATASSAPGAGLARYLHASSLSWWLILVAIAAAMLLGALHALTPGHAKTLIAAYLIGNEGTARNAVTLGAVVTFTHTASVVVIGLIALLASQFLVPGILVPGLEIVSGVIVILLGARLLRQRWPQRRHGRAHRHDHDEPHGHNELHGHEHPHTHGGAAHSHHLPDGGITLRNLVAMGVSGGLVPCPEALGVMVLAVGVNRTVLGLGLIVSFSVGLAAVLIGLGLLLVRSRGMIGRFARVGRSWTTALPLVSAAIVTLLGIGLVLKAVAPNLSPLG